MYVCMYVPIASIKDRPIINDKAETGQGTRRKCTYFTRDRHTYMHSRHDEKTAFVRTSKSRKKSIDLSIHPEQHRNEGTWSELTKSARILAEPSCSYSLYSLCNCEALLACIRHQGTTYVRTSNTPTTTYIENTRAYEALQVRRGASRSPPMRVSWVEEATSQSRCSFAFGTPCSC